MEHHTDKEEHHNVVVWKPVKFLGQGAFATVHLAAVDLHATTAPHVPPLIAVKTIQYSTQNPSPDAHSLLQESRFLHLLRDSPFVIQSYGAQAVPDPTSPGTASLHVLLEYAQLGTLEDRLKHHGHPGLPEDEVRSHAKSILHGLRDIHAHGLVHRDLKPGNLLLVSSDSDSPLSAVTKIADLGLAKHASEPLDGHFLIGTPLYMAPESFSRGEYEPTCDVWAVGCVVLELLTGKLPWDGNDGTLPLRLCGFRRHGTIPTHLSELARHFLGKCLVKDPRHRWTTEMLLSHPFVSSECVDHVFVLGEEERGLQRGRAPSIIFIDDTDDQEPLDLPDFIPLEGVKKRKKVCSQEQEQWLTRNNTHSIIFIDDDSDEGEALGSVDFIPLEGGKRRKKGSRQEERGPMRCRTPSIILLDDD